MYKSRKKIVVLSGAGISAESGLGTFRGAGGLWEGHDVREVATPEAWYADRAKVLRFYNERKRQVALSKPNDAHRALAELQQFADVQVITQNIDNLHELAGSTPVIHLHGEITKARSSEDETYVVDIGFDDIREGDLCPKGFQLRPHIVWFGEQVPEIERAVPFLLEADIHLVIGTSLEVYPAAGLLSYTSDHSRVVLVDPSEVNIPPGLRSRTRHYRQQAGSGVRKALIDLGYAL